MPDIKTYQEATEKVAEVWAQLPDNARAALVQLLVTDLKPGDQWRIVDHIGSQRIKIDELVRTYEYQKALAKQTREGWFSQFLEFCRSAVALLVWLFAIFGLVSFVSLVFFRRFF